MTETLQTTPEVGGMGHSVKRKEDPRFIRGAGQYIDDLVLPGMLWLDIVRSPYAHAKIKSIDSSEALKVPGVAAVVTGKDLEGYKLHWMPTLAGDMQMVLPTDTVMYQSAGGRRSYRDQPVRRRRRRRRSPRRLRAAAGHRRSAQGARRGRLRPPTRPRRRQADQSHLALGVGRPGKGRCRPRHRGGPDRGGHLHPPHPRGLDRDVRLHRGLGSDPPAAHPAHDQPGAPRDPHGPRARGGRGRAPDLGAEHPGQDPRHRRRIRRQGSGLPRAMSSPSRPRS